MDCRRADISRPAMPLRETEAIVLRTYRLGEADKIVSLFSRQFGRLRAVAAGAQRPKSRYGGILEPLTYIRLWLFERENRDLLRINSAELLESFFAMQQDYAVQLAAQYMAEVSERLLPEREVNERAFRLLLTVLRGLKTSGSIDKPLLYFNYWILRLGGFLPDFQHCAHCGRDLGGETAYYGGESLRVVCSNCRSSSSNRRLSPAIIALTEKIRRLPFDRWASNRSMPNESVELGQAAEPDASETIREARLILEDWVEIIADKKLITRELMANEM
ncbi:MAG TPA: DNA repair protein RecO [Terriglobia bacterium]|nr:DNA repair protein RecO [Terriglobia bacterium]